MSSKDDEWGRLNSSEVRYRRLFESAHDGILIIDPNTRKITDANPFIAKLVGYSKDELVGKELWEIGLLRDQEESKEAFRTLQKDGIIRYENLPLKAKDGRAHDVEFVSNVYKEGDRDVIQCNIRDITERKRAADAVRIAEDRFRIMVESVKDFAIFSTDPEGLINSWNTGAERMFGYMESEIIGLPFSTIFTPEDRASGVPERELSKADETGRGVDERWHLRKDSSRFFASGMVTPIKDQAGQITGFVKVARDITERKQSEEKLRESEEKFHTLADNIPQLTWMAYPDGYRFWYNKQWYDYTGTNFDQVEGWGWQSLHDPDMLPEVLERWKASIASGVPFDMVLPVRGADGIFRPFLTRVNPVKDASGTVVRWFGTNTDITERIEMEAALQEADRRKDEFLAMLAHELRNPLSSVSNAIQLLRMPRVPAEQAEWSKDVIERQVKHLARMIDDLLDVSRITRGTIELRKERIDASHVIKSAVDAVRPQVEEKKQDLTVTFTPGTLWCEADPTRLEQILINLTTNATRFTEAGGHIWLTADQAGEHVTFKVRDTGIGIPPDRITQMFELFAQGDRSIARSDGGLGIGLTVVKHLAELHGGTVTASSGGPGQGSEFTVTLPAIRQPKPADPTPATGPGQGRRSRILVVDDNVDTAHGLSRLLKLLGHDIHTAYDGPTAITEALAFQPEYILLDIGLPGMDGYEVARRLRAEGVTDDRHHRHHRLRAGGGPPPLPRGGIRFPSGEARGLRRPGVADYAARRLILTPSRPKERPHQHTASVTGLAADAQLGAQLGHFRLRRGHGRHRQPQLGGRHLIRPATIPAPGVRGSHSCLGPLDDQFSLELSQGGKDTEYQLAAGRRGIDACPMATENLKANVRTDSASRGIYRQRIARYFALSADSAS